ncbi:AAA family ATPase [Streptomyces sp. M-16]|uniref:AAA family ATPase n=1 Tax=Streptomyces sp. M-16 TaxID=3233040 RepID=UPI00225913B3
MSTSPGTEHATVRPPGRGGGGGAGGDDGPARRPAGFLAPRGVVDLRGRNGRDVTLSYPSDAAVVVAGLPGSGKSTLLRAWSSAALVVDPRATRTSYEARLPGWLPYAVYRPWARLGHLRRLRSEIRGGGPLLVHDCGSRPWMRRWLARTALRAGRPLHMVVLDVGPREALLGQHSRRRVTSRRVFGVHRRGLARLLARVEREGLPAASGIGSMVLFDRGLRDRVTEVRFGGGRT